MPVMWDSALIRIHFKAILRIRLQKLCCRQRAPPFFPIAVLLPSQHKFYQHIRAQMLSITFLPFALVDKDFTLFEVDVTGPDHGPLLLGCFRSSLQLR
jgi:hypothetical protein